MRYQNPNHPRFVGFVPVLIGLGATFEDPYGRWFVVTALHPESHTVDLTPAGGHGGDPLFGMTAAALSAMVLIRLGS